MRLTLILILSIAFAMPAKCSWQYAITNHSKKEYKAGNQNWQITQHPNGWMYIANNKGLLEYDGVYWNNYLFNYAKMRSVHIRGEAIYAGGLEQFGYYTPNDLGLLQYTSLSAKLSQKAKVGVIWDIHSQGDDIYFLSNHTIFLSRNDEITVLSNTEHIISSAMIDGKLHVLTARGLTKLMDDKLTLLPNTSDLGTMKVIKMLPTQEGILMITAQNGLYFYQDGTITPYRGMAKEFIDNNQLFCAAAKDSLIALGTVQNGILLWQPATDTYECISVENGLQNKTVLKLHFDQENNLWVGLDNGIDCIHLHSPIMSLCKSNVIGSGYGASFQDNHLYLATNQGMYYSCFQAKELTREEEPDIKQIKGIKGQVWSVRKIGEEVFCNSDRGVFLLNADKATRINGASNAWDIVRVNNDEDVLVAGSYGGLFVLKKQNNQWTFQHRIEGFNHSCKNMMAEDMKNGIWVTNSEQGIHRLKISDDMRRIDNMKNYNTNALPIQGDVCVTRIDNNIVFTSIHGLFRYNHINDSIEEYKELEELLDGKTHYTYLKQDDNRNIWYVANGTLKLIRYNPGQKIYERNRYESYLSNALIEYFEDIYFHSHNQILIGTEDGFSLIDTSQPHLSKETIHLQIRKVYNTSAQDSLIYGRSFTHNARKISLPYTQNSIRIEYSAKSYDPMQDVVYSWRLLGDSNEEWSEYTHATFKDFTHLHEGSYTFELRAITNSGSEPVYTSFAFKIQPPWYRSFWAHLLYLLAVLLFAYYIWHRHQQAQKLLLLKKEQEMLQKELEFKRENELKDQKIDKLREENLEAELKHKTAELVSSTLNLSRKNEMLLEIKKEAMNMGNAIKEGDLVDIRRKNLRLINKIDTNLEQDNAINEFQNNFDALHHGFFSILEQQYPQLSKKEKMLCAYIRTNMLSKEIAPLLNMSVRGVEITRYRLRKKLNLNEKENLYEFLQKITAP